MPISSERWTPIDDDERRENLKDWNEYRKTWIVVLTKINGWSEPQAKEWAEQWRDIQMLGHEFPCYYVSPALIPTELKKSLDEHSIMKLGWAVQEAIEHPQGGKVWFPLDDPNFDWDAAKKRVQAVIDGATGSTQYSKNS